MGHPGGGIQQAPENRHLERTQIGVCIVSRMNSTVEVKMGACGYLTFNSSLTFFLITHGICTSVA